MRVTRTLYKAGFFQWEIANFLGVNRATISYVIEGKTWRHVE